MLLCGAGCCLWTRGFLGVGGAGCAAGLLSVLMCGSAHRPDAQLWLPTSNFACNSRERMSGFGF